MKENIKQEWMKRLRSGKIIQITKRLGHQSGGRCCLGVLCDIAVDENIIPPPAVTNGSMVSFDGNFNVLPQSVRKWANLVSRDGQAQVPETHQETQPFKYKDREFETLAEANDECLSFDEIADLIETNSII